MVGARALIVKMPITSANEGILPRFLVDRASTPLPVIRIASFMRNRLEAFGFILRDPDQVTLEYITTLVEWYLSSQQKEIKSYHGSLISFPTAQLPCGDCAASAALTVASTTPTGPLRRCCHPPPQRQSL